MFVLVVLEHSLDHGTTAVWCIIKGWREKHRKKISLGLERKGWEKKKRVPKEFLDKVACRRHWVNCVVGTFLGNSGGARLSSRGGRRSSR